jgi:ribosomal-protein-alanine N-acetyltransferase
VSPGVLLRRAAGSDVAALAALEAACFTHPWTESQLREEVEGGHDGAVLVLVGPLGSGAGREEIRAYCSYRLARDEMQVMNVAVAPGLRRRGLGRFLLDFAIRRAARAGARTAFLEVRAGNLEARALYESLGFRQLGRRREYYREPVEDALVLRRDGLGRES